MTTDQLDAAEQAVSALRPSPARSIILRLIAELRAKHIETEERERDLAELIEAIRDEGAEIRELQALLDKHFCKHEDPPT